MKNKIILIGGIENGVGKTNLGAEIKEELANRKIKFHTLNFCDAVDVRFSNLHNLNFHKISRVAKEALREVYIDYINEFKEKYGEYYWHDIWGKELKDLILTRVHSDSGIIVICEDYRTVSEVSTAFGVINSDPIKDLYDFDIIPVCVHRHHGIDEIPGHISIQNITEPGEKPEFDEDQFNDLMEYIITDINYTGYDFRSK